MVHVGQLVKMFLDAYFNRSTLGLHDQIGVTKFFLLAYRGFLNTMIGPDHQRDKRWIG